MAKKLQTVEEIREELVAEVQELMDTNFVPSALAKVMVVFADKMIERAVHKFDVSIEDKKRQLELGELADKFFQRIKIND